MPATEEEQVKRFVQTWSIGDSRPGADQWEERLHAELKRQPDVAMAARSLAGDYGVSVEQMEHLARTWIAWAAVRSTSLPAEKEESLRKNLDEGSSSGWPR